MSYSRVRLGKFVSGWLYGWVALAGMGHATAAEEANGPAGANAPADKLETVLITGSYLRRTDSETPAPVQVINADEILKSGKQTISDVIRNISADNSGTLTQNFSGALAGGASGVSLRGLTLDATLVLVDGHRMAPYPLADDGQRPFVDLSSLPLSIVERIEVLKDGASAIYGSDAIAGVVNIILKPQYTGYEVNADLGSSYKGDGLSQRISALAGFGDLTQDGHNIYFSLEYRHSASISQTDRGSYLSKLDLTPYGGHDRRGGAVQQAWPNNATFTVPGMVAPLNAVNAGDPNAGYFLLPGCAPQNRVGYPGTTTGLEQGCIWDINQYNKIQPRTAGLNFSTRWTQKLGEDWKNALAASWFNSEAEQYRQSDYYSTGPTTIPYHWVGARGTLVDQTNPATTQIYLPATSLDNPFNPASPYAAAAQAFYGANYAGYVGQPALFYGMLADFGPQVIKFDTNVIRLVNDVTGTVGDWNLDFSLGWIRATSRARYFNFIRSSLFANALASGTYRVGANAQLNPASLYATLAPPTHDTASSDLKYISATATRDLFALPGGALGLAFGLEARTLRQDNPGEPYATQGDIIMDGSFYAQGSQTVSAAFVELSAPVLKQLELSAAGRLDHYNTYGSSFTPKFGIKWKALPQLALRGTFARGFRAPGIAESGNSGTGTATTGAPDPARCPYTNNPSDCGQGYVAVLSLSNPKLKPERSSSYTLGFVLEPIEQLSLTADYFYIKRENEIVPLPLDQAVPVRGAQQNGTNYPGPIIYYPTPYVNAADSKTNGVDSELVGKLPLGRFGKLKASLGGTYVFHLKHEFINPVNGNATYEYAGTVGPTGVGGAVGSPRVRGTFRLDWSLDALSLGAQLNFHSRMQGVDQSVSTTPGQNCLQLRPDNPHCYVASFTYADAYGEYRFDEHLRVNASVTNITNRIAPLNTATYGGFNYNPSLDQAGAVGTFFELALHYRF